MQGVQSRPSGFAAVTLALFLAFAGTSAYAQDKKPDEVLKGRGLKRAASATWVLPAEAVILKDVRKAQGLSSQLRNYQVQQQELEMGNQNPQVLINNYRQQVEWLGQRIDAYDQELANLGPPSGNQAATVYHNMVVQRAQRGDHRAESPQADDHHSCRSARTVPGSEAAV